MTTDPHDVVPARVGWLLHDLCVKLGFCLSPEHRERLNAYPPAQLDDFVREVFVADGLDPNTADKHLVRQVRDLCRPHFENPC